MGEMRVLLSEDLPEVGAALRKALEMTPADVAYEVRDSGLRGRGGAGFPTGVKWVLAGAATGETKYVICNADEGEPGTFKDRLLLLEQADRVFEGMAVAGHAIGSSQGIVYLRAEYANLLPVLDLARESLIEKGLLGDNIAGSGFSFDLEVRPGAGAYVCGEETSLIESLEGRRGRPRNKPPYPVNSGYLDSPTVVNNVETFVAATHIVLGGADWFRDLGEGECSGTKLFSISGDVEKPGVYELSLGSRIGDLLELAGARDIQAVQVGGASGRTIGPEDLDRRMSYGDLPPGGSVIVFDSSRDMLGVLRNFLEFFLHESCGQCTPCREGNFRLLHAVREISAGRLSREQSAPCYELASVMKSSSKCGLGLTSANCFTDILDRFVFVPGESGRAIEE